MASSADERRKLFDEVSPTSEVRAVAVPVTLETLNLPFYSARIITVVAHARNEIRSGFHEIAKARSASSKADELTCNNIEWNFAR